MKNTLGGVVAEVVHAGKTNARCDPWSLRREPPTSIEKKESRWVHSKFPVRAYLMRWAA